MSKDNRSARILRVFISSPSDVRACRDVLDEVIERINRTDGARAGVRLEGIKWENMVPRITGDGPQAAVDEQTPDYDIYIGIMSARFGTPTDKWGSGTEAEFEAALTRCRAEGDPWIALYFDDDPPAPKDQESYAQFGKVLGFKEKVRPLGIAGSYQGVRGGPRCFFEQVEQHLRQIVERIANRAEAGGATMRPHDEALSVRRGAYLNWLRQQCGRMDLLGLQLRRGQSVVLSNVYVPLTTMAGRQEGLESTLESDSGARGDMARGENRPRPQLLLDLLGRESLYVPGAPGSGKSTFCRWVVWLACAEQMPKVDIAAPEGYAESLPDEFRGRVPVLVRLRDFWQFLPSTPGTRELNRGQLEDSLRRWIAARQPDGLSADDLLGHLHAGEALLVLDGVDEVPLSDGDPKRPSAPRAMLIAGIADAARTWIATGNRLLVTSRPYGLTAEDRQRLGLREAAVEDLSDDLQRLLARRWFHVLAESETAGRELAREMMEHILAREGLDQLAANPMLLTAMCVIYSEGKRLPQDRYELYDRIVDNVLHNRFPHDPTVVGPVRGRLSVVAYGMHTGAGLAEDRTTPQAEVTEAEIDQLLRAYRVESPATEEGFRNAIEAREQLLSETGLLLPRDRGRAEFYHLSFQEFLAAERTWNLFLGEEPLSQFICRRAETPEWRNTLSLLFGCQLDKLPQQQGVRVFERLIQALQPDTLGLAQVAADCLEIALGRRLGLAEATRTAFGQYCEAAIDGEVEVKARWTLGRALGHLGDPRVVNDLRVHDRKAYVEILAGNYVVGDQKKPFRVTTPFLLSRYPVTNSQYALFMQEGGYDDRRWWTGEGWQQKTKERWTTPGRWNNSHWNAPNQPVVAVSFYEAEAFCKWAGGRLPGEYEWEVAARGPDGFAYPWGDTWQDGICNSEEVGLDVTSPVGIFPRSRSLALSLEDMSGNVWEWCADLWDNGPDRVGRGGSWGTGAQYCRAAFRGGCEPAYRLGSLGFRVVAVQSGEQETSRAGAERA